MPATILCAGSQPKYLRETFTAEDVKTAKKLIYYSDGDAAEIIFTNEILSISWFHNRHENNSDCYLSSIRYKHYVRGEIYPVSDLAFYADSYAVELPKMNDQIREFDDLFCFSSIALKAFSCLNFSAFSLIFSLKSCSPQGFSFSFCSHFLLQASEIF